MSCPDCGVPGSYIEHDVALARIENFLVFKYPVIDNWVRTKKPGMVEERALRFEKWQFEELMTKLDSVTGIDGVWVYFASYGKRGVAPDPLIPAGKKDLMTLVFAPTDAQMRQLEFFNIDYNATTAGTAVRTIPEETASYWIEYFQDTKLYLLQKEQTKIYPDFQETKRTHFKIDHFRDWLCLINCPEINKEPITHVQFTFAAYSFTETPPKVPVEANFPNHLSFVVQMIRKGQRKEKSEVINFEGYEWFDKLLKKTRNDDYDTGSPCPPQPGCGGFPELP